MPHRPPDTSGSPPAAATAVRALTWFGVLSILILGAALAHHSLSDRDIFLHDRAGRDILAGEGVPATNAYSFTAPDQRWVDHEWLFQTLVAAVAGGADLVARAPAWNALRIALAVALVTVLVLGDAWRRRRAPAGWLLLPAAVSLGMLWTRLTLRPELLSYLFLVLVWHAVEGATGAPGTARWRDMFDPRRPAGRAVLLTLVWAQCHGFYALAALVWLLVGLTAPRAAAGRISPRRLALAGGALALLAGLATPSLVQGLLYPLRALTQFTRPGPQLTSLVSELVPLLRSPDSLAWTIRVTLFSYVWGAIWVVATWGRVPRGRVLFWLVAAVAAWQTQRNLALYAVAFMLLHTGLDGPPAWFARRVRATWRPAAAAAAALLALAVVGLWLPALTSNRFYLAEGVARRWGGGVTPTNYPFAQAARLGGELRLANTIDAASTLIDATAGRVCIDGRTEAYPASAWRDYATLKDGGADALAQLRTWRADRVVIAHRSTAADRLLRTLLQAPDWHLVDADDAGVLFAPGADDTNATAANRALLRARSDAFAATLPTSASVRAADRCAAWAGLLDAADLGTEAAALLRRGQALAPDHPAILHNLGNHLMAAGDLGGARTLFLRAARINPRAAGALVNAGVCAFRLGDQRGAATTLRKATRVDPRRFEAWANLAEVRRAVGDIGGAATAYRKALALRDDPRLRARARSLGQ